MSLIWRAYRGAVETFCVAGVALILAVSTAQVVARYGLGSSLYWSEELMRYTMLWIVAAGAGLSYSRGQFLGMRLLVERLPPGLRRVADVISALLVLVFLAFVIGYGFKLSWGTRLQSAVALGISMFWVHVSVVAGAALLAMHVVLNDLFGIARETAAASHEGEPS